MPLNTKIQLRKGTSSEWSNANPVLALGEPGFDSTNNQIRIGDGVSSWNNLSIIGVQGVQGIQGYDGLQGIQGIQGEQGVQGIQGYEGAQGMQGVQGEGIQGEQGIQGYEGAQGIQGIQGDITTLNFVGEYNAANTYYQNDVVSYGTSAYVAIQNGFSGYDPTNTSYWSLLISQTIQGIQGAIGPVSAINWTGEYNGGTIYYENDGVSYFGSSYVAIYNGFSGVDPTNTAYWQVVASQGIQGLDGAQGYEGIQGIQGEQGIQGLDGIQGIQGSIPTLSFRGEYSSWTTYYLNDIVAYGSMAYVAIQNGFSGYDPTNTSYWAVFITQTVQGIQGIQGEALQGIQGISGLINWTGEYNSMTTYYENDGVSYLGSSYVVIYNGGGFSSVDPTNTSYWQLIAAQGTQGIQGNDGAQGTQGIQGEQGIQGDLGIQGIQGNDGPQGIQGITGTSSSISNYSDNRILTSDGTSNGINAETNFTYNDSTNTITLIGDGTTSQLTLERYSADITSPTIQLFKSRGSLSSPAVANTGDAIGQIQFRTYNYNLGLRTSTLISSNIENSGTVSSNNASAYMTFSTSPGGGAGGVSPIERLRITGSGNVGIGTTTPSYRLDVTGTGNFSQNLLVNGTAVSLTGHTHTASNITDFNSSVSGLLPTISNSGDNRILTSTGSTTGINAESNLTFDGTTLSVSGTIVATSGSFSQRLDAPLSYNTVSPAVSGTVNDWNPGSRADVIRISGVSTARINGLVDTYASDAIILYNVGTANNVTLTHASGTANNQFIMPWAGDCILTPSGGAVLIIRDKVDNKWRIT